MLYYPGGGAKLLDRTYLHATAIRLPMRGRLVQVILALVRMLVLPVVLALVLVFVLPVVLALVRVEPTVLIVLAVLVFLAVRTLPQFTTVHATGIR